MYVCMYVSSGGGGEERDPGLKLALDVGFYVTVCEMKCGEEHCVLLASAFRVSHRVTGVNSSSSTPPPAGIMRLVSGIK